MAKASAAVASTTNKPRRHSRKDRKWCKPDDKPKHPLSAYNIFFQCERARLMAEVQAVSRAIVDSASDRTEICSQENAHSPNTSETAPLAADSINTSRTLGFAGLARRVAARWKTLDAATREQCNEKARIDKRRYQVELAEWKQKQKAQQQQKQQQALDEPYMNMLVDGRCSDNHLTISNENQVLATALQCATLGFQRSCRPATTLPSSTVETDGAATFPEVNPGPCTLTMLSWNKASVDGTGAMLADTTAIPSNVTLLGWNTNRDSIGDECLVSDSIQPSSFADVAASANTAPASTMDLTGVDLMEDRAASPATSDWSNRPLVPPYLGHPVYAKTASLQLESSHPVSYVYHYLAREVAVLKQEREHLRRRFLKAKVATVTQNNPVTAPYRSTLSSLAAEIQAFDNIHAADRITESPLDHVVATSAISSRANRASSNGPDISDCLWPDHDRNEAPHDKGDRDDLFHFPAAMLLEGADDDCSSLHLDLNEDYALCG